MIFDFKTSRFNVSTGGHMTANCGASLLGHWKGLLVQSKEIKTDKLKYFRKFKCAVNAGNVKSLNCSKQVSEVLFP